MKIEELQELLSINKNKTINDISKNLNVTKTKVAHWFRKDNSFAIPDPKIWDKLKTELNIETDSFDAEITEFIEKDNEFEKSNRVYDENGLSPTLTCGQTEKIVTQAQIRRLTPRECFRLQTVAENHIDTLLNCGVSNSQLYKVCGNGWTIDVIAHFFKELNN